MKIDTSSINGFEEMSPEDKLNAILGLEIEDGADEITRLKTALSKSNSENADYKKKMKEKMSEDERLKAEQIERQKELEDKLAEYEKKERIANCSVELAKLGYNGETLVTASEALAGGDLNSFFKMHASFLEGRDKEAKAKAMENMSDPSAGDALGNLKEKQEEAQLREWAGLK